MAENPFKIEIAENKPMGCYDIMLHVGGLKDRKQAEQFADIIKDWMIEESGWAAKVQ